MDNGFVKLWRRSLDSRVFNNEGLWKVWTWCLLKASHKKRWYTMKTGKSEIEIELLPGQFVFGRHSASKLLKMKPSTVRNRIEKLSKLQNLDVKKDNQYSIITIVNWDTYQPIKNKEDIKEDNQRTIKGQPKDTNKNVENVKNAEESLKDLPESDLSGDGKTEEIYITAKKRKLQGKRLESFNLFWSAFNYKKGKAHATDSWLDIPRLTNKLVADICKAAKSQALKRDDIKRGGMTPIYAQGWLTGKRWEDEDEESESFSDYCKRMREKDK